MKNSFWTHFFLKKEFLLLFLVFSSQTLFAKPDSVPDWVQNYRTVYPNSEYLAQRGSGETSEMSKNNALASLSRYFQSNVNSNLSTTMSSITDSDSVQEKTMVVDSVSVDSQVSFFGLEYTEPYYYKREKKWYCVVYLNRSDVWQQYKPQIDIKKSSFDALFKNMEEEKDYLTKAGMAKKVWFSGMELLQKLEYGRIINPKEEAAYETEREKIASIPVILEEAKENCSIYIRINQDYNRTIVTVLSTVLSESGFRVSKTEEDANYIAEVTVDENVSGSNPLSIKPWVNIKIISKTGKAVYSHEVIVSEKSIGYTLESAQKKCYPNLAKELGDTVKQSFTSIFLL